MMGNQRLLLWLSAAVALVVGLVLVMQDSGAGWFLIIVGIIDIGLAAGANRGLPAANQRVTRLGLISAALLLIVLIMIAVAVYLARA